MAFAVTAADYAQTENFIKNGNEGNENINNNQDSALIIFGGVTVLTAVAALLPDKWRKFILGLYIGQRVEVVRRNARLNN